SALGVSPRGEASLGNQLALPRATNKGGNGLPCLGVALVRVLLPVALFRRNPISVNEADAAGGVDVAAFVVGRDAAAGDPRDQEPGPPLHALSRFPATTVSRS